MSKSANKDTKLYPLNFSIFNAFKIDGRYGPISTALIIAGIYMLTGVLWILFSDRVLLASINNKDTMILISMIKGWVYVFISSLVIYFIVFATLKKARLKRQYEELRVYQEKLHYGAYHDPLTGLQNRISLYENLAEYLIDYPNNYTALLFIDMDNFKFINDTMGHSFGDQLIAAVGVRLSQVSGNNHVVYRIGGDEFIYCCYGFNRIEEIEECAEKIMQNFSIPFEVADSILHISVSIGISIYPQDGDTVDSLMQSTDIALYKAKSLGKNKYVFYNGSMQRSVRQRMMIEKHLRSALQNNEFRVYYQPQMDIKTGKICGFEALLRWNNAELGFVPPLEFIGVSEETHLIIPIGDWVLRNACLFIKQLHVKGYTDLTISVNVSIIQLLQEDFVEKVQRVIELIDMQPENLELEITESTLIESFKTVRDKLSKLKAIGVKIALDDFGQGYSSLNYLKQLPINTLKIDKCFIDNISTGRDDDSLTDMIVKIGRKIGLTILAEGVETQAQLDYLKKNRCHRIQGYLISKPLPREEVIKLYEEWN